MGIHGQRLLDRKIPYLSNINHVLNIPTIMQHGLLSHDQAKDIDHLSIALESVQERREKSVINGLPIHQYASLYFAPRNPMMFYLKCHPERVSPEDLCVLMVSPDVLDNDGVVVTDGNAAAQMTRFFSPEEGIPVLQYDRIFAKYWTDANPFIQEENKRIKCAEVLVPYRIPYNMILGALVPFKKTEEVMREVGFDKKILICPDTFFQQEEI